MRYVKSASAGFVGAVLAVVLWVIVALVVPVVVPFLASRNTDSGGIGASSAYIDDGSILRAALVGFVAGSYWMFRKSRSPAR